MGETIQTRYKSTRTSIDLEVSQCPQTYGYSIPSTLYQMQWSKISNIQIVFPKPISPSK